MNGKMGFSLLELTFVIVILSILAMFAIPEYTKTHREAKIAVLNDMRGKLTNAVDNLKTASNIDSRRETLANGLVFVQYDSKKSYRVSGQTLYPTEICHILGLRSRALLEGIEVDSTDGNYTCKNVNKSYSWIKMNKLESTECTLSYRVRYNEDIITSADIKLVGECLE
ncbi:prepilin-type N-terminal cleavage/methylation domain-containing protein [Moritella sp. 24]|uniref:type II secretion system protein n=1 Tax=Moritella sp. 24 TaxID=2746230 RepID=UPI001BAE2D29|nr:prepilin-type N-terminal cleavage/methylation domain-containing protein [Moritella sp. 24]QUM76147.1 prepilin-type N-terminal cleavage/methylation domain-containing protein [Moritella sp. 24]